MKRFNRLEMLHLPRSQPEVVPAEAPLPFDQEQRYRAIGALLRTLRAGGQPLRVLDVGGRTGALCRYLADDDRIVVVDPETASIPGFVRGLGEALPFATDAFDAVVAADTLEHVPEPGRKSFVQECVRVARNWIVLAGPYHHPRVVEAEERLAEFVRTRIGTPHRYLEEHRALGLPRRELVEAWCRTGGAREVRAMGHGNLERWLGLMSLTLLLDRDPATRDAAQRLHRFYNESLLPADRAGRVYRHIIVAVKRGALPAEAEELLASPEVGPEVEAAFGNALDQLHTFDQHRDVLHAERARLEGEIARRDADLWGHARALEEAREEVRSHRAVLGDLGADLEGHRHVLQARELELDGLRQELERVQRDAREFEKQLLRKTRWRRALRRLLGRTA